MRISKKRVCFSFREWCGSFAEFAFKTCARPLGYWILSGGGADLVGSQCGWIGAQDVSGQAKNTWHAWCSAHTLAYLGDPSLIQSWNC